MSGWTESDLLYWDEKITRVAEDLGLTWHPIDYEIIDYHEMLSAMAYTGLPTHYRHWSYGKEYERSHTLYNMGQTGLPYEMIINSNPSIAYLMRENALYTHILTMAHCVGHSDFFKNNRMFVNTNPNNILDSFKSASRYVRELIEDPSIGIDKVENILDAAHSIKYQVPRHPGIKHKTHKDLLATEYQKMKEIVIEPKKGLFQGIDLKELYDSGVLTKEELISELQKNEYDAVLCLLTDNIDGEVFDAVPSAKIFANYAVGYNNIDVEEAKKRGIIITNTPGVLTETVAEHTMALMLSVMRRVQRRINLPRKGNIRVGLRSCFLEPI